MVCRRNNRDARMIEPRVVEPEIVGRPDNHASLRAGICRCYLGSARRHARVRHRHDACAVIRGVANAVKECRERRRTRHFVRHADRHDPRIGRNARDTDAVVRGCRGDASATRAVAIDIFDLAAIDLAELRRRVVSGHEAIDQIGVVAVDARVEHRDDRCGRIARHPRPRLCRPQVRQVPLSKRELIGRGRPSTRRANESVSLNNRKVARCQQPLAERVRRLVVGHANNKDLRARNVTLNEPARVQAHDMGRCALRDCVVLGHHQHLPVLDRERPGRSTRECETQQKHADGSTLDDHDRHSPLPFRMARSAGTAQIEVGHGNSHGPGPVFHTLALPIGPNGPR